MISHMASDGTLFGKPARRAPWTGSKALVLVGTETCPACGSDTVDDQAGQLPLLRHGGFGAVQLVVRRACTVCTWALVVERSDARPSR